MDEKEFSAKDYDRYLSEASVKPSHVYVWPRWRTTEVVHLWVKYRYKPKHKADRKKRR